MKYRVDKRVKDPDARYRSWLATQATRIPIGDIADWLKDLLAEHGTWKAVSHMTGLDPSRLRDMSNGTKMSVQHHTAERIAMASGRLGELIAMYPVGGVEGWSEHGECCGAGVLGRDGCGTWFHPHHSDGLCEECYYREVKGFSEIEPRDVRVSREVLTGRGVVS